MGKLVLTVLYAVCRVLIITRRAADPVRTAETQSVGRRSASAAHSGAAAEESYPEYSEQRPYRKRRGHRMN